MDAGPLCLFRLQGRDGGLDVAEHVERAVAEDDAVPARVLHRSFTPSATVSQGVTGLPNVARYFARSFASSARGLPGVTVMNSLANGATLAYMQWKSLSPRTPVSTVRGRPAR